MIKSNIKKQFSCDKNKLWNIITDNSNYKWRTDLSKAKEKLKEYKFDLENANLKGKWIGIFKELPNGNIELDFTEEIEVNSLIMKLLAKPYLKSQQKRYMRDLEKELNK